MTTDDRTNSERPRLSTLMDIPPPRAPLSRRAIVTIVLTAITVTVLLVIIRPHISKLDIYARVDDLEFSDPVLRDCVRRTARENNWSDAGHFVALRCNNPTGNGVRDLTGIQHLVQLKNLDLAFNELTDVSVLASLPHLVSLELSHNRIVSLPLMLSAVSIRSLEVNFNRLKSLQWLDEQHFALVEVLSLAHNEIDRFSETSELPRLYELNLRNNHLSSIDSIPPLPNLVMLDVGGNRIDDLSGIGQFSKLRRLFVDRNALTNLKGLQDLEDLDELDVSHNSIQSTTPLSGLLKLERLNISQTRVRDLDDLLALGGIEVLRASGNPDLSCDSIDRAKLEYGADSIVTDASCRKGESVPPS